ncbi:unnamed protein product [Polarella glacialis]|uniref:Uncharacterized protein n=1 Tax=Polarella glacialis TaxID=89957 RepID=A0A813EPC0_POLGL|nr:unnamed protein product [Polarella glacialis]
MERRKLRHRGACRQRLSLGNLCATAVVCAAAAAALAELGHGLGSVEKSRHSAALRIPACLLQPSQLPRRRALLPAIAVGLLPLVFEVAQLPAAATFGNALPEAAAVVDTNNGIRPGDLGLDVRKLNRKGKTTGFDALKSCPDAAVPNCLSTTMDFFRQNQINSLLVPWKIPAGAKPEEALAELRKLIQDYPPGQDGVDAGGFRLVEAKPTYLYAQFANSIALISDVEFAVRQDGTVLLRSAARSMSADPFGVVRTPPDGLASAKRLNYFASRLRQVGWTAPDITRETHPEYFKDNVDTSPGFTFQRKPGQ